MGTWSIERTNAQKRYISNDEEQLQDWEIKLIESERHTNLCKQRVNQYKSAIAIGKTELKLKGANN